MSASLALTALMATLTACSDDDAATESSNTTVPVSSNEPENETDPNAADPSTTPSTEANGEDEANNPANGKSGAAEDPAVENGDLSRAEVRLELVATLEAPIDTVTAPNGEFWAVLRTGRIVVLDPASGATGDVILDLSAETTPTGEQGLLGAAVDAGHLYVNFTDLTGDTRVDSVTLDGDGRPTGERRNLLSIAQPYPNHNGGGLVTGPDGHLYIGVGDGGAAGDPLGSGQDPTQLLGSILRIDPTPAAAEPYAIPADNPFVDTSSTDDAEGRPEIFLLGVRNPWRFAFDPATDDLWVADVGQNDWEEITMLLGADGWGLGANLGWNLREGTHEFTGDRPAGNVDPVFEYPHQGDAPSGCSISGGQVYRGDAIPDLVGAYVFGDYCASNVWAISIIDDVVVFADLGGSVEDLVAITTDPDGELLTLSLAGDISRVVPA